MFFRQRFKAPRGAPFWARAWRWLLTAVALGLALNVQAAPDIPTRIVLGVDFEVLKEALLESIEAEGLVVGAVIPYGQMLARTARDLERPASPFQHAEIVQFCSARLAWLMIEEDISQVALCPLSIALLVSVAEPGQVVLAYRIPGTLTPARLAAEELLRRIAQRTIALVVGSKALN